MVSAQNSGGLVLDNGALDRLKLSAKQQTPESLKQVAKQFEALFLGILTKSMRAGSNGSLLDNQETGLYTELLDQQFAQQISAGRGLGLADALVRQLNPQQLNPKSDGVQPPGPLPITRGAAEKAFSQGLPGAAPTPLPPSTRKEPTIKPLADSPQAARRSFVDALAPYAKTAAQELGVKPQAVLAQAALESGWGRRQIRLEDGSPSYNVFGIKAGANWNGPVARVSTTEYVAGVAQRRVETFRAYGSYDEAFRDYANLLKTAPRYRDVLHRPDVAGFAQGLQHAGYATDPRYATKIASVARSPALLAVA